jgi:dipeptidyl aminopeptidase/acylaminoacyl peptidase
MMPAKPLSTVAAGILQIFVLAGLLVPGTLFAASVGENSVNDRNAGYDLPAPAVVRLLTAPPPPQPLVHTASAQVALLFRQAVIPLARLAKPFEGLAGYRFDPVTYTSGADPLVEKVELVDALAATPGRPTVWQPGGGAGLAHVRFSPDGHYLSALKVTTSGPARLASYDIRRGTEKVLEVPVNSAWGRPCAWVAQQSLICRLRPLQQRSRPAPHWAPVNIEHEGGPAPTRTYSNLLENDYEDQLFEHYFDTELAAVGINGKVRRIPQTRGMIYRFEPSPDGSLAIIRRLQPPYPRLVPVGKFPNTMEVWDLETGERRYMSDTEGFGRPASPAEKHFTRRIVWKPGKESGAYNRTLTPFGFQREKRSFWDATDLYTSISPFFHANDIQAPILLVHGGADPNPGTPPMQARRFFHAMVGEGVPVRYVELPFEAQHYWDRENVLDSANEMIVWPDRTIACEDFTGTPCPAG